MTVCEVDKEDSRDELDNAFANYFINKKKKVFRRWIMKKKETENSFCI